MEVHEPAYVAGLYAETRAHFSPRGYQINGLVLGVDTCPCDWTNTTRGSGSYDGLILAVAEGACTECASASAACAAKQAEASGLLLPDGFGDGVGGSVTLDSSCEEDSLPTAFISLDDTAALLNASRSGDTINATMADPDEEGFDCTTACGYMHMQHSATKAPSWWSAVLVQSWLIHSSHP